MSPHAHVRGHGSDVVRWLARASGTLVVAFFAFLVLGHVSTPGGATPTIGELALLALFPVGVCVGYLLAWRRPRSGGAFALACLALFLAWTGVDVAPSMLRILAVIAVPGVLFLCVPSDGDRRR